MLRTYLTPMGALATERVGQANRANNLRVAYLCGFGFAKVGHSSPGLRDFDFSSIFLLYPLFSRFSAFPPRHPLPLTSLLHPLPTWLFISFLHSTLRAFLRETEKNTHRVDLAGRRMLLRRHCSRTSRLS